MDSWFFWRGWHSTGGKSYPAQDLVFGSSEHAELTLREVEVDWDRELPEPKWASALRLREVSNLRLENFRGQAARPGGPFPAVRKENVTEQPAQ